ncbi:DNA double-strand break repair Rad50 ATPase [Listeria monocytogenes]|nr:DNA double-strand break repair Rad50 ATPase [Listeria monocytogenes]EHD5058866.1 DNA double-strand break repair Rad50 ATPase [Listeria monocytogenes]
MDIKSQQMETQLQLLKKEHAAAEDFLQDLQRQQNEKEWLAEDIARVHQEEQESLEFLREVWQGAESRSFGCQKNIYQLENQQQDLQKELLQ